MMSTKTKQALQRYLMTPAGGWGETVQAWDELVSTMPASHAVSMDWRDRERQRRKRADAMVAWAKSNQWPCHISRAGV